MPVRASVRAGACGFEAVVHATCSDGLCVTLQLESNCPKAQEMAAALHDLTAPDEVLRRSLVDTMPAQTAAQYGLHASCPIPGGILKIVEAAAGLALPARSEILVGKAT